MIGMSIADAMTVMLTGVALLTGMAVLLFRMLLFRAPAVDTDVDDASPPSVEHDGVRLDGTWSELDEIQLARELERGAR